MRLGRLFLLTLLLFAVGACATPRDAAPPPSADGTDAPSAAAQATMTPPATADVGEPTPVQTEGPYFKAGAPRRASLREGAAGAPLVLTGRVLDVEGDPFPEARVDFWQAGPDGAYDLDGFRYRGYQLTRADGAWLLETVKPGPYATRTPHIHVRVTPPSGKPLVTQLYFPGEPRNATDGIFDERLLLRDVSSAEGTVTGRFDFVLAP